MFQSWQDFVALGLVLAALAYSSWRVVKMARGRGSCGGCSSCANKDARPPAEQKPLVEITPLSGSTVSAKKQP